ncbi:MAG: Coupling protein TraD [Candidatus Anoxychlamydiales bacterium]|nr:Coupling protein TraD [Candidatus Anoxychlamydiales bacterium]
MASYDLAHQLSKTLGERETSEIQEGISYGANEIRDGVNLSKIIKERPTVSPTNLLSLGDLEVFIKMPGNIPLTKIKLKYKKIASNCSSFVIK